MNIKSQYIVLGLIAQGRYSADIEAGNVISHIGENNRVLSGNILPTGYTQVGLDLGFNTQLNVYVHQFIYLARYGSYNPKYTIDHIDRNKLNNCYRNLLAGTHIDNLTNSERKSLKYIPRPRKTNQQKEMMILLFNGGGSFASIAKTFNCSRYNVSIIIRNTLGKERVASILESRKTQEVE